MHIVRTGSTSSMGAGYAIIPNLPVVSEIEGLKELPEDVLVLTIPQIMNVIRSALAFSILIGLAAIWTKAKTTHYYFR